MAEAFFNSLAKGKAFAISAGTKPASQVNPIVAKAMLEMGIDIRQQQPKLLTAEMLDGVECAITMGCSETEGACPASFIQTEDWGLEDPEGKPIEIVRKIRDEIKARVEKLIKAL